ncbi:sensor histidine kinase [Streptococcus loxodontisalivarius]|uniref:histidine kinase n=1 Tax=Streptococcus loxodontisalivarius TaxID=1349415 RepID=A0ABS2PUN4_9STRE|nr:sensor histidine kinase [Streptococcus loxodontisalivarius]MBM7643764.1 signal transduction histidine kinase [Streptococcus loxodontisalivarius]
MNAKSYEAYARWTKHLLVLINSLAVLLNASIYLFASKYILATNQSHRLLENLPILPQSPVFVYWSSLSFLAGLLMTIYLRQHLVNRWQGHYDWLAFLEVFFLLLTFVSLQYSYNGLILLVFSDIFYSYTDFYQLRSQKTWFWFIAVSFGLILLTNFDLLSLMIKLPSLSIYLAFLPASARLILTFIKNFLGIINMVVFLVSLVAFVIYSVSENHKIEEELRMADRANKELTDYVSLAEKMAEDRERKRIAREIHDTLGHALTGISAGIDAVRVLIDLNPSHAKEQLQNISVVVREGIQDVRRSLEKLRPGALEKGSLKEALLKMIADYENLSKLQVHFSYDWDQVDLDITREDVVFRVIQESVTNSLRHGHASEVTIEMTSDSSRDNYQIFIEDNGQGCDDLVYGYGLTQMQERLAIIGGQVSFASEEGFQTRITIPKRKGEDV